ncbi:MAG: hypothetical protein FJZ43_01580 [Candidatus Staskawiczbacteria bacterium]|nr:hypothetical protein [Candidatus Staskawiczbacteria bacterium]
MTYQNFSLLFVGLALAANGVLGSTIFLSNRKSATNKAFLFFTASTMPWGVLNYLTFQSIPEGFAIWVLRGHIFFAVWYCFFLFNLFYTFPESNIKFSKIYSLLILPIVIIVSLLTLSPFVFSKINSFSPDGGIGSVSNEPGIILFGITVVFLIFYSIYILWKKLVKASGLEKANFKIILYGISITFLLHVAFNLVMPVVFHNTRLAPFGSLFIFPFILSTSYAIIRNKLFNIRVAGSAILVFALSVLSFFEILLADSFLITVYRSGVLILILAFGVLLIRGVLREVEQREEIEKMAVKLENAYVIEKRAKEEIEKIDKFKDQFLMVTQHNLRTPLTSMMGYTDLLLKGFFGKQNKKTTEVLFKFQGLTQGMIRMVNNFLDMAQFQLGKGVVALKPGVDVLTLVNEIVGELQFKAESKGVYVKLVQPEKVFTISADREKLKAAIFNIVDNAVKYTERGGVTIKIQDNGAVRIIISDTGIGIPKEKLSTIFEDMFERTEAAKRVTSIGSGVGLYLAGQIIKAHKGKVWVESEGNGKGSIFYIELPVGSENGIKPSQTKTDLKN